MPFYRVSIEGFDEEPWCDNRFVSFKQTLPEVMQEAAAFIQEQVLREEIGDKYGQVPVYTNYHEAVPYFMLVKGVEAEHALWAIQVANLCGGFGKSYGTPKTPHMTLTHARNMGAMLNFGDDLMKAAQAIIAKGDYKPLIKAVKDHELTIKANKDLLGGNSVNLLAVEAMAIKAREERRINS